MTTNNVLLTTDIVDAWFAEIEKLTNRITELTQAREDLYKKIEAARILFPDRIGIHLNDADIEDLEAGETMIDAIPRILSESKMGMTTSAIRDALSKDDKFAGRLKGSPNYLYTAISRLVKKKVLEKRGQLYFVPQTNEAPGEKSPDASETEKE